MRVRIYGLPGEGYTYARIRHYPVPPLLIRFASGPTATFQRWRKVKRTWEYRRVLVYYMPNDHEAHPS